MLFFVTIRDIIFFIRVLWYNKSMKRALCILMVFLLGIPCMAEEEDIKLPNIFIWSLPEEENISVNEITSSENEEEEITLIPDPESVAAKGYAEFIETADTVYLKDENNNYILNLRVPQKLETSNLSDSRKLQGAKKFSLYNREEYSIAPQTVKAVEKHGNFSLGTLYGSGIDTSQLERSTTLFTRYDHSRFAISSAYKMNELTTRGLTTDNVYIAPELKLSKIFSLSEVLSADITRNRRKGELVLSVSPLKDERMRLEFGAGTTYDLNTDNSWSQVRFNTNFKL